MTWEEQARCRFYPMCMIHTGEPPPKNLTPEDVNEIRSLLTEGLPTLQIARVMGVSTSSITRIKFQHTYKKVPIS